LKTHCKEKSLMYELSFSLQPENNHALANFCGVASTNISFLEKMLTVTINMRGFKVNIKSQKNNLEEIKNFIINLYDKAQQKPLNHEEINLDGLSYNNTKQTNDKFATIITARKHIVAKSYNQNSYIESILKSDLTFGIGPAGCGKTYLAVAVAVMFLIEDKIQRIILVRPAVEAGERLGFLPGDLNQKVDPFLRPIYDALYEFLGYTKVTRLQAEKIIEIAPLAFMRGRTLNNSFIIMDEAQNTTIAQMKMFLTRMGINSKVVVTGDITQIDLPNDMLSGLKHAKRILSSIKGCNFINFQKNDIFRHPLVQRIVEAYEKNKNE
jgi:phosphate starvation-inducible protein PhoH and related proteins